MRIGLINVGVNTSHVSLRSPLMDDRRFDFVPIPERKVLNGLRLKTYMDVNWATGLNTEDFIPKQYWNAIVHNDPEFVKWLGARAL